MKTTLKVELVVDDILSDEQLLVLNLYGPNGSFIDSCKISRTEVLEPFRTEIEALLGIQRADMQRSDTNLEDYLEVPDIDHFWVIRYVDLDDDFLSPL